MWIKFSGHLVNTYGICSIELSPIDCEILFFDDSGVVAFKESFNTEQERDARFDELCEMLTQRQSGRDESC